MKRTHFFSLLPVLAALLWGNMAWAAAEASPEPPAQATPVPAVPTAPAMGQQGIVLGQPDVQQAPSPATVAGVPAQAVATTATAQAAAQPNPPKQPDAQALFEESLRQMMPLDDRQIQEYRKHSDQRERALLPVSPALNSRTVRVSLEPGTAGQGFHHGQYRHVPAGSRFHGAALANHVRDQRRACVFSGAAA